MLRAASSVDLGRDSSSRFLPWIIALMVFMAALALAAALVLQSAVKRWDAGLTGSLTVQVPPAESDRATETRLARVVEALRAAPGIAVAEPLSRERTGELLEPWLGKAAAAIEDLPLPRLVDVRLAPGATVGAKALDERLRPIAAGIATDDHQIWLARLIAYARAVEWTAIAVVSLIALVAVATVVFATLTRMRIHREVIDLLHLVGATDAFVARQFQRQALRLGFGGGVMGLAMAAGALWTVNRAAAGFEEMLLPVPHLEPWQWAVLLLLPLVTGIVAMLTARWTVLLRLSRMP